MNPTRAPDGIWQFVIMVTGCPNEYMSVNKNTAGAVAKEKVFAKIVFNANNIASKFEILFGRRTKIERRHY